VIVSANHRMQVIRHLDLKMRPCRPTDMVPSKQLVSTSVSLVMVRKDFSRQRARIVGQHVGSNSPVGFDEFVSSSIWFS